jgi:sigma-B regulation protein RsbU (phosphoserine phosphatase)
MLTVMVEQIRVRAHAELEAGVTELTAHHAARVDARFEHVARVADATAAALSSLSRWTRDDVLLLLERDVASDRMVWSSRLSLDGNAFGNGNPPLAVKVGRQKQGGLIRLDLIAEGIDFSTREWATAPRQTGEAAWTGRYKELRSDGEIALCSYTAPIFSRDSVVGVVTVDVAIDDFEDHFDWIEIEGGEASILSADGRIVSNAGPELDQDETLFTVAKRMDRPEITDALKRIAAGETGVIQAEGLVLPGQRWISFAPMPTTGWSFVKAIDESAVLAFSRSQLQLGLAILLAGLAAILFLLLFMATRITRPIGRLAGAVRHLGAGDLDTRVTGVESRDEIGDLAQAFNRMVGDLKTYVDALTRETAARESVESEMRVGRDIQASLLPRKFPQDDSFELHALNIPARHVAGDFYDWFRLDDGTLVFLIADVSGKGVPAALYMAVARTVLRQVCAGAGSLAEAVGRANDVLEETGVAAMYVTLFIAWYVPASGELRYVCAGHPPGYRITSTGQVQPFGKISGRPVGMLPGAGYEEGAETLAPGDCIVLFTDGVPEAEGPDEEFFGDERLQALLGRIGGESAEEVCKSVAARIADYEQGSPHDDVTLVALRRR